MHSQPANPNIFCVWLTTFWCCMFSEHISRSDDEIPLTRVHKTWESKSMNHNVYVFCKCCRYSKLIYTLHILLYWTYNNNANLVKMQSSLLHPKVIFTSTKTHKNSFRYEYEFATTNVMFLFINTNYSIYITIEDYIHSNIIKRCYLSYKQTKGDCPQCISF